MSGMSERKKSPTTTTEPEEERGTSCAHDINSRNETGREAASDDMGWLAAASPKPQRSQSEFVSMTDPLQPFALGVSTSSRRTSAGDATHSSRTNGGDNRGSFSDNGTLAENFERGGFERNRCLNSWLDVETVHTQEPLLPALPEDRVDNVQQMDSVPRAEQETDVIMSRPSQEGQNPEMNSNSNNSLFAQQPDLHQEAQQHQIQLLAQQHQMRLLIAQQQQMQVLAQRRQMEIMALQQQTLFQFGQTPRNPSNADISSQNVFLSSQEPQRPFQSGIPPPLSGLRRASSEPIYRNGSPGRQSQPLQYQTVQVPSQPQNISNLQHVNPYLNSGYISSAGDSQIYDESDYAESEDEEESEESDNEPSSTTSSTQQSQRAKTLIRLVEHHQWLSALQRMKTHPHETTAVGIQGRTPLHVACDHDAPPALVHALLIAWPEGAERVGTSRMNPLHITCTSPRASVDVVRVLLAGCRDPLTITGMKDVDGDTPLHAACRCGAPLDVLITLLQVNPITVLWRDYEGLNPLLRLWVRYFVICGEQVISSVKSPNDLTNDLLEAWQKSLPILQVMDAMVEAKDNSPHSGDHGNRSSPVNDEDGISATPPSAVDQQQPLTTFRAVHAASAVDCPRCILSFALALFPDQVTTRDERGRLPIHIAAAAPVYAVHDLRGEGYTFDDAYHVPETLDSSNHSVRNQWNTSCKKKKSDYEEPSVIDILLNRDPSTAKELDPHGQLPLHLAIMRGKTLEEGVQGLINAHPDALTTPDVNTNLYPFMLAASVGRGKGDCSTIYELLKGAPELVKMGLTEKPKTGDQKKS